MIDGKAIKKRVQGRICASRLALSRCQGQEKSLASRRPPHGRRRTAHDRQASASGHPPLKAREGQRASPFSKKVRRNASQPPRPPRTPSTLRSANARSSDGRGRTPPRSAYDGTSRPPPRRLLASHARSGAFGTKAERHTNADVPEQIIQHNDGASTTAGSVATFSNAGRMAGEPTKQTQAEASRRHQSPRLNYHNYHKPTSKGPQEPQLEPRHGSPHQSPQPAEGHQPRPPQDGTASTSSHGSESHIARRACAQRASASLACKQVSEASRPPYACARRAPAESPTSHSASYADYLLKPTSLARDEEASQAYALHAQPA
jgi:hypothetical protein